MTGHVSDLEIRRILTFCRDVLATLQMPPHFIVFGDDPSDDDAHASINATDGRYAAHLRVSDEWETYTEQLKIHTLVHEMLHLTHAEIIEHLEGILLRSPAVSQELYGSLRAVLKADIERWVDRMTNVVCDLADLVWPEDPGDGELRHTNVQPEGGGGGGEGQALEGDAGRPAVEAEPAPS
jgi:hypothetical protein